MPVCKLLYWTRSQYCAANRDLADAVGRIWVEQDIAYAVAWAIETGSAPVPNKHSTRSQRIGEAIPKDARPGHGVTIVYPSGVTLSVRAS